MPILNIYTLEKLFSWMQPEDRMALLQALLLELPKDAQQLQQAIAQGDLQKIKKQAHRIKGAYGNLGCDALCNTMCTLETAPEVSQRDAHLQTNIDEQLQQTFDELRAYQAKLAMPQDT